MKFYHWTKRRNLDSILEKGLIKNNHLNCVCLTDINGIESWKKRAEGEILFEVYLKAEEISKFKIPDGSQYIIKDKTQTMFLFPENIGIKRIKVIDEVKLDG